MTCYIFEPGKPVQITEEAIGTRTFCRLKSYMYIPSNNSFKWWKCRADINFHRQWTPINKNEVPDTIKLKVLLLGGSL